jgi:hypothetical protein
MGWLTRGEIGTPTVTASWPIRRSSTAANAVRTSVGRLAPRWPAVRASARALAGMTNSSSALHRSAVGRCETRLNTRSAASNRISQQRRSWRYTRPEYRQCFLDDAQPSTQLRGPPPTRYAIQRPDTAIPANGAFNCGTAAVERRMPATVLAARPADSRSPGQTGADVINTIRASQPGSGRQLAGLARLCQDFGLIDDHEPTGPFESC